MNSLLWLIPTLPLVGFLILTFAGAKLSRMAIAFTGVGSVSLSALLTLFIGVNFLTSSPVEGFYSQTLWQWLEVGNFRPEITLRVDALSLVFIFVITFIGALIHLYSAEYMAEDSGYARFFAYMNLFVFSMLMLVLADNLLLMYLGWEGVGLCSYLLIGFWYENPDNGYAARKAFIITRVGDTAMAVGLFMLFKNFGTLNISDILALAPQQWDTGSQTVTIIALLLMAGGLGKSAQLPLQTWLPDAMAGPSPVSALIHAATMVTAGVYLIARMNTIFTLAPVAQMTVAIIGALTLLIAGFSAITQYDIKRVLAYSTISQIGYMFLALGVGAWSAGIFHFFIHAFFKALLFLGAGAVIMAVHHEQDMFKMGGLKTKLPVIFWTFLVGSAALAALPLFTAGFYSKDPILWYAWASEKGNVWLWLAAFVGAIITAIYTTRMILLTFYGEAKSPVSHIPGKVMTIPLIILASFSFAGGFIELPHNFGHLTLFSDLVQKILPAGSIVEGRDSYEWVFQLITGVATISAVYSGYLLYYKQPELLARLKESSVANTLHRFWFSGWGFDRLYDTLFVKPLVAVATGNKHDSIDKLYTGIAELNSWLHRMLSYTQSGSLRWYVMSVVLGALAILTVQLLW